MPTLSLIPPLDAATAAAVREEAPLGALPLYLYGSSLAILNAGWFTPGKHYAQLVAEKLGGGSVTSYGVSATRSVHTTYALLAGAVPPTVQGVVAGSVWPGVSQRPGLVILDSLGNDIGHYPSMAVSPVVPAVITAANNQYLDSMEALYKLNLALMSTETRHEAGTGTTNGTWALGGGPYSAGAIHYTTAAGAYWEKAITPPQSGPMAGKVFIVIATLASNVGVMAQLTTTVNGGSAASMTPSAWEIYTGINGGAVNIGWSVVPVTMPVDGAAHTVRIAHAGSAGQYLYVDAVLVPSETPNPIAVMGMDHPPVVKTGVFTQAGVNAWRYNTPLVTNRMKTALALFPHAFYVPSTMTPNGLYSLDGLHPNDRGMEQRANDLLRALRLNVGARLTNRALSDVPDSAYAKV